MIFCPARSGGRAGRAQSDDRPHPRTLPRAAGAGSRHGAQHGLLRAAAGFGGGSGADAPARRVASRHAVRRRADAAGASGARGAACGPPSHGDADEADGDFGDPPAPEHEQARAGPQDLSVSAAGREDRAAEPCVGDGHQLHPDATRLRLSGGGRRRVQPARAGPPRSDHVGGGVLRRGARRGAGAPRQAGHRQPIRAARSPRRSSRAC